MIIHNKNRKIDLGFARKMNMIGKITGLMFKSKNTEKLLFEFNKDTDMPIHSFFVFFPFLAVWTDEKNNVQEFKVVMPFTLIIKPKRLFRKLVEIPINNTNVKIIKLFVGKGKI